MVVGAAAASERHYVICLGARHDEAILDNPCSDADCHDLFRCLSLGRQI